MAPPEWAPPARWAPILLAVAVVGCDGGPEPTTAGPEQLAAGADQVMISVRHFMTREGVRRAALAADTAYVMEDESVINLIGVRVVFYDTRGNEESVLTATKGTYHSQSGNMAAEGGVTVVKAGAAERLETEQLAYDAAADKLRSDVPFVFKDGSRVIRGASFVSDPSLDNREIQEFSAVTDVDES